MSLLCNHDNLSITYFGNKNETFDDKKIYHNISVCIDCKKTMNFSSNSDQLSNLFAIKSEVKIKQ